jgi:hypothetical protein
MYPTTFTSTRQKKRDLKNNLEVRKLFETVQSPKALRKKSGR